MRIVSFVVPGPPKGKARPKVTVRGNYAHAYTPKETINYENYVKIMYLEQCKNIKLQGAIRAAIIAYFPIPKSTSKKNRALMRDGAIMYTKKVDCDNLAKVVLDSLNGIAYDDDAQVSQLSVDKVYGEDPRVTVVLSELNDKKA